MEAEQEQKWGPGHETSKPHLHARAHTRTHIGTHAHTRVYMHTAAYISKLPNGSVTSKTAPPAGDQVFKHPSLCRILIQTSAGVKLFLTPLLDNPVTS